MVWTENTSIATATNATDNYWKDHSIGSPPSLNQPFAIATAKARWLAIMMLAKMNAIRIHFAVEFEKETPRALTKLTKAASKIKAPAAMDFYRRLRLRLWA